MRLLGRPAVGGGAGQLGAFQIDVPDGLGVQLVVVLGDGRGREGVGLADVRARAVILVVQVGNDVGAGDAEDVVVPLHLMLFVIAVGRDEAVAPEVCFFQPAPLDHDAPGPVEDQDAFLGRRVQGGDTVLAGHTQTLPKPSPSRGEGWVGVCTLSVVLISGRRCEGDASSVMA
ncbi:hypothetical protein D3C72_1775700 [compost metagenome]